MRVSPERVEKLYFVLLAWFHWKKSQKFKQLCERAKERKTKIFLKNTHNKIFSIFIRRTLLLYQKLYWFYTKRTRFACFKDEIFVMREKAAEKNNLFRYFIAYFTSCIEKWLVKVIKFSFFSHCYAKINFLCENKLFIFATLPSSKDCVIFPSCWCYKAKVRRNLIISLIKVFIL